MTVPGNLPPASSPPWVKGTGPNPSLSGGRGAPTSQNTFRSWLKLSDSVGTAYTASSDNLVNFGTVAGDSLSEWSSGVFSPRITGQYFFRFQIGVPSALTLTIKIKVGGTVQQQKIISTSAGTTVNAEFDLSLVAANQVEVTINPSIGFTSPADGTQNQLTIGMIR